MGQLTVRAAAELIDRVRKSAAAQQRSMNDYVVAVLDAATNPDLAGDEAERVRGRLERAGLLASDPPRRGRRPSGDAVADAGRRAARGTALSDIVAESR